MPRTTARPKSGDRVCVKQAYGDHVISFEGVVKDVLSKQFTVLHNGTHSYVMFDDDWSFDAEETA